MASEMFTKVTFLKTTSANWYFVKDAELVFYCCVTNYSHIYLLKTTRICSLPDSVYQKSGHGLVWCLWLEVPHVNSTGWGCSISRLDPEVIYFPTHWCGSWPETSVPCHVASQQTWLLASPRVKILIERGGKRELARLKLHQFSYLTSEEICRHSCHVGLLWVSH